MAHAGGYTPRLTAAQSCGCSICLRQCPKIAGHAQNATSQFFPSEANHMATIKDHLKQSRVAVRQSLWFGREFALCHCFMADPLDAQLRTAFPH